MYIYIHHTHTFFLIRWFLSPFLDHNQTTHYSNIGVCLKKVIELGPLIFVGATFSTEVHGPYVVNLLH